ncbi:MAG: dephospho-CoA kinase [Cyanobacteriota bacterium]|jgi:dephospho-CoA kinase
MSPMRRIGLTGGIASGKSTVAHLLADQYGITVLDADRFARDALAPSSSATRAVIGRYGPSVIAQGPGPGPKTAEPRLDRAALGRIVFADPQERRWLEALVHPLVRERFANALAELALVPVVVLMIPLLFEAGLEGLCSEIWVVDCGSEEEQIHRLMARDQLGEEEARARLKAQWPMDVKRARADVILFNSGTRSALAHQVRDALAKQPGPLLSAAAAPPASAPDAPGGLPAA